ncbi:Neurotransmitter-gated ion-channel ligand-binding domain, partial [Trinorchestia longiramus]
QIADNRLALSLLLSISWSDSRLEFLHLQETGILTLAELESIWVPIFTIKDADFDDNYNLLKFENIFREGFLVPLAKSYNSVRNGSRVLVQSGDLVEIQYKLIMDVAMICAFDLAAYPFDVQRCPVRLQVFNYTRNKVQWDKSKVRVHVAVLRSSVFTVTMEQVALKRGNSMVSV